MLALAGLRIFVQYFDIMNKEKETALNRDITIYWWNHGKKIKDFEGTYKEWFFEHKINYVELSEHLWFSGIFGSMKFTLKLNKDYEHSFNQVIKLCLMYLGDKALLIDGFNRQYKINWR